MLRVNLFFLKNRSKDNSLLRVIASCTTHTLSVNLENDRAQPHRSFCCEAVSLARMILHHCSLFCARDNVAAPCSHLRIWYPQFPVRKQYILKQGKTDIFHHKVYSVTESLVLLENDSTQWFPNPASQSKKYLGVSRPFFGGSPRHITSAAIYTST